MTAAQAALPGGSRGRGDRGRQPRHPGRDLRPRRTRARPGHLTGDRRELARRASGIHATEAEARDYARREGPAVVLTPAGEVLRIERERDATEDARIAAEQAAAAERARWIACPHRDRNPRLHRPI